MAAELLPIRAEPAPPNATTSFLDDDDIDPFMFEDAYYEEEQTAAWAAMAAKHVNKELPCEGNFFQQPPDDDITESFVLQTTSASGGEVEMVGGGVLGGIANAGLDPSTPIRSGLTVDNAFDHPTPKRRRLTGKSTRPPAYESSSPPSSWSSVGASASADTPAKTSSVDQSNVEDDPSLEEYAMPVDEWRKEFVMAYNVMRRFFYNSPEHHDLKKLPKVKMSGKEKKTAVYSQWTTMPKHEQVKLAEFAIKSNQLSDPERKAVNCRYLLQKKRPLRSGQLDQDKCFFHAVFGLFTYHADKWLFDRPSWMSKSVSEVSELCKKDDEMRRAWTSIRKDLQLFRLCHFNPKFGAALELCTDTFKTKGQLKLHLHICLKWLDRQHIRDPAAFKIDGVVPVHVKQPPRDCLGPRARNTNPMLYYLEMPKIGGVFHEANEHAYTDYSVNPRWITGWLQGKKITAKDASEVTCLFINTACGSSQPHARASPQSCFEESADPFQRVQNQI